ncbi:MAG: phosphorylated adapter RNA export RNA-binding domain-containing protein [Caldilineaceae bacterium]
MPIQPEALLKEIIETLNELNEALVQQVIAVIGAARAQEFLQRTLDIEANGGLLTANGQQRRTPGGVFFQLVRKGVSKQERKAIFPKDPAAPRMRTRKAPVPPMTWEEAQPLLEKVMQHPQPGFAKVTQLRLMGRPKRVGIARTCIVCEIESSPPTQFPPVFPSLPPDFKQTIGVFMTYQHWERVIEKLLDFPETELIIDGWPYIDATRNFFGIFAQNVTVREFLHLPPEVIRNRPPAVDPAANAASATLALPAVGGDAL